MQVTAEIDWVSAWYDTWAVMDSTINFRITATFAVIVAIHALGEKATRHVKIPVAALYFGFSMFSASRMGLIFTESETIMRALQEAGIDMFGDGATYGFWTAVGVVSLVLTFVFGTCYTLYFVLRGSKGGESQIHH